MSGLITKFSSPSVQHCIVHNMLMLIGNLKSYPKPKTPKLPARTDNRKVSANKLLIILPSIIDSKSIKCQFMKGSLNAQKLES